jgi:two-component system cell cycle response regulator DivK
MKTALIIEDNADNMELISFILEKGGYNILKAETGEEGVEMTLKELPDFVILDIQLPGIDGYEVLHRIRKSEVDGSIPIIAVTSYAMSGDRERLLGAGCNGYIEKPIEPERFIDQIKKAIGNQS